MRVIFISLRCYFFGGGLNLIQNVYRSNLDCKIEVVINSIFQTLNLLRLAKYIDFTDFSDQMLKLYQEKRRNYSLTLHDFFKKLIISFWTLSFKITTKSILNIIQKIYFNSLNYNEIHIKFSKGYK